MFDSQEQEFLNGKDNELYFDGEWKADNEDLFVIDNADATSIFADLINRGNAGVPRFGVNDINEQSVRGIVATSAGDGNVFLIQRFKKAQYLAGNRVTILCRDDDFVELEENGLTLATHLTAVVEGTRIKFVSFAELRAILPVGDEFLNATDAEVQAFSEHWLISTENFENFGDQISQPIRRKISRIVRSEKLRGADIEGILEIADDLEFQLEVQNDRIVLPSTSSDLRAVIDFLDESYFRGRLSGERFVTNSKRRA